MSNHNMRAFVRCVCLVEFDLCLKRHCIFPAEMIAALLWLCGPFHGLIIDYASIRYSFDVTCYFFLTTLAGALTNGFVIRYVYEMEGEW